MPDFPRPILSKLTFTKPPPRANKDKEAEEFRLWLRERDATNDLVIYFDGSQIKHKGELCTGWGFSIRKGDISYEILAKTGRLLQTKVFDAKAYSALQGLTAARAIAPTKRLYICLDNTSVVDGFNGISPESFQAIFLRF